MTTPATAYGLTAEQWRELARVVGVPDPQVRVLRASGLSFFSYAMEWSILALGRRVEVARGVDEGLHCVALIDVPVASVPAVVATWSRRLAAEAGPHV